MDMGTKPLGGTLIEVLDLQLAPKDELTAADKMYPSMSEK
jgi:hypothetical protein